MASVRQRDEDMSRMQRPREWPVRNERFVSPTALNKTLDEGKNCKALIVLLCAFLFPRIVGSTRAWGCVVGV